MEEPRLFKEILAETIESSGLSIEKIVNATGVPERFIIALIEGNYSVLPAAPYTRGYIKKMAEILDAEADALWVTFERESRPRRSGREDALPQNRFLMRANLSKKNWIIALAIIVAISYLSFNTKRLTGAPDLRISAPEPPVSQNTDGLAMIRGRVEDSKDTVTINGDAVYVDEFGEFQKEFSLDPGVNNFEIMAKKFLGRSKTETRQIIYEPLPPPPEENKKVE
jgi:plasmid maintenance system antidote protein VapI